MINKKELKKSVVPITGVAKDTIYCTKYDAKGICNNNLNDNDVVASSTKVGGKIVFRARKDKYGDLYNPLLEGSTSDYGLNKRDRFSGNQRFKLKEISEVAFNNYIQFLSTRYDSFIIKANREQ